MGVEEAFQNLLRRARTGDPAAAGELLQAYEPQIRRAVRIWLRQSPLRQVFDSADIWQSVIGTFLARVATDWYELRESSELLRLLVTMARNRVRSKARKEHLDRRFHLDALDGLEAVAAGGETPSEFAVRQELHQKIWENLTEEERRIAQCRVQGQSWKEIAAERGGGPEAVRKQFERAIRRVAQRTGLDAAAGE